MEYLGINPALFTPLTDDGEDISPERLRRLLAFLLKQPITGLFVGGSTGEGVLLSPEERERLVEITLAEVAGQVPVMVHVGAAATRDSVRLAKHAARCGAAAVSSIPPFPFALTTASVIGHWQEIGAATDLPMYIYYFPALGTFTLDQALIDGLKTIPNLAGLKFTSSDFFVMRNLIDGSDGRLRVLSGPDELCLPAQVMGAKGAIGSTYNWMAPLFCRLWDAWQAGDLATAEACQARANGFIRLIFDYEKLAAQKAIMEYLKVGCGPTRRPIRALTPDERASLFAALDRLGLADLYQA